MWSMKWSSWDFSSIPPNTVLLCHDCAAWLPINEPVTLISPRNYFLLTSGFPNILAGSSDLLQQLLAKLSLSLNSWTHLKSTCIKRKLLFLPCLVLDFENRNVFNLWVQKSLLWKRPLSFLPQNLVWNLLLHTVSASLVKIYGQIWGLYCLFIAFACIKNNSHGPNYHRSELLLINDVLILAT